MEETTEVKKERKYDLSYEGISNLPISKFGNGELIKDADGYRVTGPSVKMPFAEFTRLNRETKEESPWKIHISLDKDQLAAAWDKVIFPFLSGNRFDHFKVTALNRADEKVESLNAAIMDEEGTSEKIDQGVRDINRVTEGLQVTIYIPQGKEEDYYHAMKDLRRALDEHGYRIGRVDDTEAQLDDNDNPISIRDERSSKDNREISRAEDKDEVRRRFKASFAENQHVDTVEDKHENTNENKDDIHPGKCCILS